MKRVYGNTAGLKAGQLRRLENLYRRRIPPEQVVTPELARELSLLAHEIRRQIGLLVNRQGRLAFVVVGDPRKILLPEMEDYRAAPGRLNGLRFVHTHLDNEPLTQDDLTDLALLRLDLIAAIGQRGDGEPLTVHVAHVLPKAAERLPYRVLPPQTPWGLDVDCLQLVRALESELERTVSGRRAAAGRERALLVSVATGPRRRAAESMAELRELARSAGIETAGAVIQHRDKVDARFLIGTGKLQELTIQALQEGASLIVFDQELNPSQIRSITDQVDLKIIDRSQLILDIFAQRALSREGKLQVELAQLRYMLPRLVGRNTALSRLAGGIGGRGPGETKLEIDRRRVRERIARLEDELEQVRRHRRQRRALRGKKSLPVISIIGYTNAGKSTLLNSLTKSRMLAESRMFATLDPASRRLKFPRDIEVIVTDTVGFIRDLPQELMVAFRATLEELEGADLLLHVVDIANPRFEEQIRSVEAVIAELHLEHKPCLKVFNKRDLLDPETVANLCLRHGAVPVSALEAASLKPLIDRLQALIAGR
ncbi:MAG: GTPase HflX [Desulfobacterales bacterium]|jgi:GTP-binding protein HflX|nr:GTPase HflX [Desulfobacterales bacterium]